MYKTFQATAMDVRLRQDKTIVKSSNRFESREDKKDDEESNRKVSNVEEKTQNAQIEIESIDVPNKKPRQGKLPPLTFTKARTILDTSGAMVKPHRVKSDEIGLSLKASLSRKSHICTGCSVDQLDGPCWKHTGNAHKAGTDGYHKDIEEHSNKYHGYMSAGNEVDTGAKELGSGRIEAVVDNSDNSCKIVDIDSDSLKVPDSDNQPENVSLLAKITREGHIGTCIAEEVKSKGDSEIEVKMNKEKGHSSSITDGRLAGDENIGVENCHSKLQDNFSDNKTTSNCYRVTQAAVLLAKQNLRSVDKSLLPPSYRVGEENEESDVDSNNQDQDISTSEHSESVKLEGEVTPVMFSSEEELNEIINYIEESSSDERIYDMAQYADCSSSEEMLNECEQLNEDIGISGNLFVSTMSNLQKTLNYTKLCSKGKDNGIDSTNMKNKHLWFKCKVGLPSFLTEENVGQSDFVDERDNNSSNFGELGNPDSDQDNQEEHIDGVGSNNTRNDTSTTSGTSSADTSENVDLPVDEENTAIPQTSGILLKNASTENKRRLSVQFCNEVTVETFSKVDNTTLSVVTQPLSSESDPAPVISFKLSEVPLAQEERQDIDNESYESGEIKQEDTGILVRDVVPIINDIVKKNRKTPTNKEPRKGYTRQNSAPKVLSPTELLKRKQKTLADKIMYSETMKPVTVSTETTSTSANVDVQCHLPGKSTTFEKESLKNVVPQGWNSDEDSSDDEFPQPFKANIKHPNSDDKEPLRKPSQEDLKHGKKVQATRHKTDPEQKILLSHTKHDPDLGQETKCNNQETAKVFDDFCQDKPNEFQDDSNDIEQVDCEDQKKENYLKSLKFFKERENNTSDAEPNDNRKNYLKEIPKDQKEDSGSKDEDVSKLNEANDKPPGTQSEEGVAGNEYNVVEMRSKDALTDPNDRNSNETPESYEFKPLHLKVEESSNTETECEIDEEFNHSSSHAVKDIGKAASLARKWRKRCERKRRFDIIQQKSRENISPVERLQRMLSPPHLDKTDKQENSHLEESGLGIDRLKHTDNEDNVQMGENMSASEIGQTEVIESVNVNIEFLEEPTSVEYNITGTIDSSNIYRKEELVHPFSGYISDLDEDNACPEKKHREENEQISTSMHKENVMRKVDDSLINKTHGEDGEEAIEKVDKDEADLEHELVMIVNQLNVYII